ncbi:hypothetical protein [Salegentibacter sp. UBA1130]|uniref:hypothetical protein n=1 Tax=Salegentibacter sp. UBA1130 TaxID=1947451 RepID=UPI00257C653F|nr:hypothetical protein [Salegentibacter sp. UBA1130]
MKARYREGSLHTEFLTENICKESILWYSLLESILKDIKYWQLLYKNKFYQLSFSELILLKVEIEECTKEVSELLKALYRHVNDIDKLLECDEVECEYFHLNNHLLLYRQIDDELIHFLNLKLRIANSLKEKL